MRTGWKWNQRLLEELTSAIEKIDQGQSQRIDITPEIKVYRCKNVIRIDVKSPDPEPTATE